MKANSHRPAERRSTQEKRDRLARFLRARAQEIESQSPLSLGQRGLWFLQQTNPRSAAYHVAIPLRIRSVLDLDALQRGLNALIARHPSLRTTFSTRDGEPVQRIHGYRESALERWDASSWSWDEVRERAAEAYRRPFELEHGPLFRVHLFEKSTNDFLLLILLHHLVGDFWSTIVLVEELQLLYRAAQRGTPLSLPPLTHTYSDYVRWQADMLRGSEGHRLWNYWKSQLGGELPTLDLGANRAQSRLPLSQGASFSWRFPDGLVPRLKALAQAEGVTLYMTLLAVFHVLLHQLSGEEDILTGSPTSGRTRPEFSGIVGYFVNPVVVRTDLSGNPSFLEFLHRVRDQALQAFRHQDFPFPLAVERLRPKRDSNSSTLFQVMFALDKWFLFEPRDETSGGPTAEELNLEVFEMPQQEGQFDLTLEVLEGRHGLSAVFKFDTGLFDRGTIQRLAHQYEAIVGAIVERPAQHISEIPTLTPAERRCLMSAGNGTQAEFPRDLCVHRLFEIQAKQNPNAVAVSLGPHRLSYAELNHRANQLAHWLRARSIGPDITVGLCLEPSFDMIVGILAILKAGAAYVPLDPASPKERLDSMIGQAAIRLIVTLGHFRESSLPPGVQTFCFDEDSDQLDGHCGTNPETTATPRSLFYVIFTSGSTGTPKGVAIGHRNFMNLLTWFVAEFKFAADDRCLLISSLSFDLTQKNIFAPLTTGGSLELHAAQPYDPAAIVQQIFEKEVTWLNCTPSAFYPLVENVDPASLAKLDSLRYVLLGGEPINVSRLLPWITHPGFAAQLVNTYGPTECTDVCAFYRIQNAESFLHRPVPIGRPISNAALLVLGEHGSLRPIGVTGELYIGGESLGAGYVNDAAMTQERFVHNPFPEIPGDRLYRSGDLGRWLSDGTIELTGRRDDQVKIRGFRLSLNEVERALCQCPGVRQAVAVTQEDGAGNRQLAAFILGEPKTKPSIETLRQALKARLPEYMVPSAFAFVDQMPETPSGKIDRRALGAQAFIRSDLESRYVAPRSPTEHRLAPLWSELLGVSKVGVHDSFFELGGHSLLAARLVSRIRDALGLEFPLRRVFESATIAQMARDIDTIGWMAPAPAHPEVVGREGWVEGKV